MNCIIPGPNLKVFSKALHALAKIGDDLYVEATKERLCLVTLNLRKTVCVRLHLLEIFFSNYEIDDNQLGDKTQTVSCKIHMKTLLPLFKGHNLDKKLDYVKIEYENNNDFIIFKMKYKCDDILMTHNLRLMESETLTIDISSESGCNTIVTTSTFYNQLLNMFSNSDDEILFEVTKSQAIIRNYYVGAPVRPKSVRSQVSPNGSEFTIFQIDQETTINFSLKPFRTAIQFAEGFNLNISLNFETGGRPLSVVMKNPTFEMNFLIATLNPYNDNQSTIATSIPARITQANSEGVNDITMDDQEALLNENWDDFSIDTNKTSKSSDKKRSKKTFSFREVLEKDKTKSGSINSDENCDNNHNSPMDVDDDVVQRSPESPTRKKAKLVFGKCFESTFSRDNLGSVLAPNSDSE
ncbi:cell cycle checkpoint control protein RAD9B-like isoform X1 [Diabrotica virgifera virgifera]|uniref:Cell cycle checkpoint control protein n=1 Tax=Diabrotica virgifera virgifera TaxID=50390 RepID=A0ABM5KR35_DIAVI|nr:cell cycle checkpoint control protein RAD9B-like isoform X1 [Diabrotica virgifera virgifera]